MFKYEFIKFFEGLSDQSHQELCCYFRGEWASCSTMVKFNDAVHCDPWSDPRFKIAIKRYLEGDGLNALNEAYSFLETLAKEDALCREAQIASVQEDISSALSQLRTSAGDLQTLFGRLHTLKGERRFPEHELQKLEDVVASLHRIPTLHKTSHRGSRRLYGSTTLMDLTERI